MALEHPVYSGLYFRNRGLGIRGLNNLSLDFDEIMSIDFGTAVVAADLTLVDIHPPGNVSFQFEAFNRGSSLGIFGFPGATSEPETYDLFALSGVSQMTSFSIAILLDQLLYGLQVQSLSFSTVPAPSEIIQYAVWLYYRFNLSHRRCVGPFIEGLLAERGIDVTYEAIRLWCNRFGPKFATSLKRKHRGYSDTFFIDEVFVNIDGKQHYLRSCGKIGLAGINRANISNSNSPT